ncbi:MAG: FecCD family ABC transporter permease [Candidatus Caldatribacteriaceae bacterium]
MSGRKRKKISILWIFTLAFAGALLSIWFATGVGEGRYRFADSLSSFFPSRLSSTERTILFQIRLPRIVLSFLVGGGLATCGAVLQGIFQNPLVDPYVLGVSSGAALGAVVAILSGIYFGLFTVPLFAFLFAALTALLVFRLSLVGKKMPLEVLLLSGIAMGFFLSAFISLGMFIAGENLHQVVFWTMGGFWGRGWLEVKMVLPFFLGGLPFLFFFARELNTFLLGEKVARSLGVDVEKVKRWLILAVSFVVASCVSVSGVIGFVGLLVPHILRLFGYQDHRFLLPLSFLFGGVVLLLADTLARSILHPVELPVGIVTSILGSPFFIYLLRKKKREL